MTENDLKRSIKRALIDNFMTAEEYQVELALAKIMDCVGEAILQARLNQMEDGA